MVSMNEEGQSRHYRAKYQDKYLPKRGGYTIRTHEFNTRVVEKTPEQWARIIEESFECDILKGWVASAIEWRFIEGKQYEGMDLSCLHELAKLYPSPPYENPYPMSRLDDAFGELGIFSQSCAFMLRRDATGIPVSRQNNPRTHHFV